MPGGGVSTYKREENKRGPLPDGLLSLLVLGGCDVPV